MKRNVLKTLPIICIVAALILSFNFRISYADSNVLGTTSDFYTCPGKALSISIEYDSTVTGVKYTFSGPDCMTASGSGHSYTLKFSEEGTYGVSAKGGSPFVLDYQFTVHVGHDYEDSFTIDLEPTCVNEGSKSIHCRLCGEKKNVTAIPAKGHSWETVSTVDIQPTCTKAGSQSIHCENCNEKKNVEEIPAQGHDFVNGTCIRCGVTEAVIDKEKIAGGDYWTLYEDGTLVLGKYQNFGLASFYPWNDYRDKITNVIFTTNPTLIGDYIFYNCSNLKNISIPESVTTIGICAFNGCSSLEYLVIPDNVTSIEDRAFVGCSKLKSIEIPDSVTNLGVALFQMCSNLENASLPEGTTTIGAYMFYYCDHLSSFIVPDNVTSIQQNAFCGCEGLKSITIPVSVNEIIGSAFSGCNNIKFIVSENSYSYRFVNNNNYKYDMISGHSIVIDEAVAPDCTHSGKSEGSHCSTCGEILVPQKDVPNVDHVWNDYYTVDKVATCKNTGTQSIHCAVCGGIKEGSEIAIPKLTTHKYGAWKTTKASTEIAAGQRTRTCSVCGYAEKQSIAMLRPTLPSVKIAKPKAAKKSATFKWKKVSKKNQKKIGNIQIQYSLDKSFRTGVKTVTAKKSASSKKVKKLVSKKTYYVRVRAYKKTGNTVHVSAWSGVKAVKVK